MRARGRRLILDSGVVVAAARGELDLGEVVSDADDVALSALTIAEYLTGVLRGETEECRMVRRAFLDEVLEVTPVEDYTPAVAEHHAVLLAHTSRAGRQRGAHDLIIAATARATGRLLLSTDDRARFDELPGVASTRVRPGPRPPGPEKKERK